MTAIEFSDRSECMARLRAALLLDTVGGLAGSVSEGLLEGFADACEEATGDLPGGFRFQCGRWVIRDEDLKLFATVRDIITPVAAVGYVLSSLPMAGVTALVLGLIDLLRKSRRFGAWLTPPHAELVAVFRAHREPMSPAEILRELPPRLTTVDGTGCQ